MVTFSTSSVLTPKHSSFNLSVSWSPINQVYWNQTIAICFFNCSFGETLRYNEHAPIGRSNGCTSEISYFWYTNRSLVFFILKDNMKAHQLIDTSDAFTIHAIHQVHTVTLNMDEPLLA